MDSQKSAKLSLNNLRKLSSKTGWWCYCIRLFPFLTFLIQIKNAEIIVAYFNTLQNSQLHNTDQCIQLHKYKQVEGKSIDFDINIDLDNYLFNHVRHKSYILYRG